MRRFIVTWFILSGCFLLLVFVLGVIWTGPELVLNTWSYYGSGIVDVTARGAVDAYRRGGLPALEEFERRVAPDDRMRMFLFDPAMREVHSAPVPPEISAFLPRLAAGSTVRMAPAGRGVITGRIVEDDPGQPYRFVAIAGARTIRDLSLHPVRWLLRLGGLLIAVAAVCSWLALRLSLPLVRLRAAARAFADGNLSARAHSPSFPSNPPEFQELARDFDEMADRIAALLTARQQLLRDISHELRTPLTRLSLASELARSQPAAVSAALDRIDSECARLNDLISRILRLSRIQSSDAGIHYEPIELSDFIETIVSDASFEAQATNREVILVQASPAHCRADRELLREALENVIRNGIRFTPAGSAVLVDARIEAPDLYRITVRDAGPGVPGELLPSIFDPFYRAPNQGKTPEIGFGLGLAIARRAMELHRGRIEARNHPEGGLEVSLYLPTNADKS